jgi:hypothetical protein
VALTSTRIEIRDKVFFKINSDVIEARSFDLLSQVATVILNHQHIARVRVEGHTDDTGGPAYNMDLSKRRAESVRQYLIERGVAPQRLESVGYGPTRPIASNRTARGRETNRRVEFAIAARERSGPPAQGDVPVELVPPGPAGTGASLPSDGQTAPPPAAPAGQGRPAPPPSPPTPPTPPPPPSGK